MYKIIEALNRENLEIFVNKEIRDGFKPIGGVSIISNPGGEAFFQAVYKPNKKI
jgi:hypothetical protein